MTPLHLRTQALPEHKAIGLLLELGAMTEPDLKRLFKLMRKQRPLPPQLENLLQLILFAQLAAPTPSLH